MKVGDLFDLHGKTAVITGGGRGIGFKMAQGLAEAGANVVICSRKVETCRKATEQIAKMGVKTLALGCDVRSPQDVQRVIDAVVKEFSRLDILVNNSGASWGNSPEDYPLEGWHKVLETNITGAFLFSQSAGRVMIAQRSGNIINIASVMGLVGTEPAVADAIAYSASKGALVTFTKDLAAKWAKHNIRINAIAPGWFPTDMSRWILENRGSRVLEHIPLKRFGEGDELKGAVVFLASEASSYVTGVILPVDGGYLTI
jgi:NAD(P)-dependent dehydrogenase (short-subunit alcohol dehydrogenase family)